MIWLKDKNVLTLNRFTGDKLRLKDAFKALSDKTTFVETETIVRKGRDLPLQQQDLTSYTQNRLIADGPQLSYSIYESTTHSTPKPTSLEIVAESLGTEGIYNDIRLLKMLRNRIEEIEFISRLSLKSEEDKELLRRYYEDFSFFAKEVLGMISFETIQRFNVADLRAMEKLAFVSASDEAKVAAVHITVGEENQRVVDLAREVGKRL